MKDDAFSVETGASDSFRPLFLGLARPLTFLPVLLAALALLYFLFGQGSKNFADAALGAQTISVYPRYDGDPVHCRGYADAEDCLGPAKKRALDQTILWLGNSQLHAINQRKNDEYPASFSLTAAYRQEGVEVLTFSQPNASLTEHRVLLEYVLSEIEVDLLLLPVVFDDLREGRLREDIRRILEIPALAATLRDERIGGRLATERAAPEPKKPDDQGGASLQVQSEERITAILETCCGWETLRAQARGEIMLWLYDLRNFVFGIDASTPRPMIPATYRQNLAAFEDILARAEARDMQVLVYIPPIRSDVPRPYVAAEYAEFKRKAETLSRRWNARFANLEEIVPGELWGIAGYARFGGDPIYDFMHFQHAGHVILAEELRAEIAKVLE